MGHIIQKKIASSNYKIEQFSQKEIDEVEKLISSRPDKKVKKFIM